MFKSYAELVRLLKDRTHNVEENLKHVQEGELEMAQKEASENGKIFASLVDERDALTTRLRGAMQDLDRQQATIEALQESVSRTEAQCTSFENELEAARKELQVCVLDARHSCMPSSVRAAAIPRTPAVLCCVWWAVGMLDKGERG